MSYEITCFESLKRDKKIKNEKVEKYFFDLFCAFVFGFGLAVFFIV